MSANASLKLSVFLSFPHRTPFRLWPRRVVGSSGAAAGDFFTLPEVVNQEYLFVPPTTDHGPRDPGTFLCVEPPTWMNNRDSRFRNKSILFSSPASSTFQCQTFFAFSSSSAAVAVASQLVQRRKKSKEANRSLCMICT